jgi:ribosome biogenesis protein Tsr3
MPFNLTGETDASMSTLRVEPDQVLRLKAELQPIYDEVNEFLKTKAPAMIMRPLGTDPVSSETAQAFNENAQTAIDAAWGYLDELENVLNALDQAVKTYNLVEDTNTQTFRQGAQ